MTRSLPSSPCLEHLKNEAKAVHKAHKAGDTSACAILRNIKKLSRCTDQDILGTKVSLQQVQYALAVDYGFASWDALRQELTRQLAAELAVVSQRLVALLKSGTPIPDAVDQTVGLCRSAQLKKALTVVAESARNGSSMATAMLEHSDVFPEWAAVMTEVGERIGRVPAVWNSAFSTLGLAAELPEEQDETRENSRQRYLILAKLTALIDAGLPLVRSLNLVAGDTSSQPFRQALSGMGKDIVAGSSFSEAMVPRAQLFGPDVLATIRKGETTSRMDIELANAVQVLENTFEKPVTRFISAVLDQAVKDNADEVEFSPNGDELIVRFRAEGEWHEVTPPPAKMTLAILARLKGLSGIAETEDQYPQKGSMPLLVDDKRYDVTIELSAHDDGETIRLLLEEAGGIAD